MWVILAVAALLMPPDEPAAKLSGSRVRVTTRAVRTTGGHKAVAKPLIGTLAGFDEHMLTLVLAGSGEKVVVPADQVLRLETLVRPSRKTRGAVIGASILGGAALALVVSLCSECEGADPATARTSGAGRTRLHLGPRPDKRGLTASVSLRPF